MKERVTTKKRPGTSSSSKRRPRSTGSASKSETSSAVLSPSPGTLLPTENKLVAPQELHKENKGKLAPLKHGPATSPPVSQFPDKLEAMSAMSALQLDDASLRLQRVDTLRTQQNVTLMQIVEIEKRLEEQRLEMLTNAMPGDRKRLLRAFRHEREAAARNIRKVVAKQRADLRSAMIRYNVEFLGRSSQMIASPSRQYQSLRHGEDPVGSQSARRMENYENGAVGQNETSINNGNFMEMGVTGAIPTLPTQSSAILNSNPEHNSASGVLPPLPGKR